MGGITHKKPAGQNQGHRKQNVLVLAEHRPTVPTPPSGLLKPTRDRWYGFWASQVARAVDLDSDLPRLRRWIAATDEYDRVAKTVKRARLVKGSMGQPVLNPLIQYLAQLEGQIAKAETEFGMTPMARLRLGIQLAELKHRQERDPDRPGDEDRRRRLLGG
jgi:P27 family predicted phage terminase small subunit